MSVKYSTHTDPYIDPETGILRNLRGITDESKLNQVEAGAVGLRTLDLRIQPLTGSYDLTHIQGIHNYLFQDIYEWAGQLRTIDLIKDNSRFANHLFIERQAEEMFKNLAHEDHLLGLEPEEFSARAAHYMAEINALHPFREGNGRAQREFINHLAVNTGYLITWENAADDAILSSTIKSFHGNEEPLAQLIASNLKNNRRSP